MTRTILVGLFLCASTASAQGRARQGGPPQGPTCLDMSHVERIEMLKGASAVAAYGADATNGIVVIVPKAGVSLSTGVLGACPGGASQSANDPFATKLFSPSVVLSHQQAINLTDEQKQFIQQRMAAAQRTFAEADAKMRGEMETLDNLLGTSSVDETKVLATIDRVLALEREIKRTQVSLMVSVKNNLTEQQQAALRALSASE